MQIYAKQLAEEGYFLVRQGFSDGDVAAMRSRLEAIVAGRFVRAGRRFQADTDSGDYDDVEKVQMGYRGPDIAYRKIADLEYDEVFLEKLQSTWIRAICEHFLGEQTSIMRITMMDKPAHKGTPLPWHQDVSHTWPTLIQPELALWFCLDGATAASGALQIIPRSHAHGAIQGGHLLAKELEQQYAPESAVFTVEVEPGDVLFFDARLLHRSGTNSSDKPRRAINAILMPGAVMHTKQQRPYPVLSGPGELRPEQVAQLDAIPGR